MVKISPSIIHAFFGIMLFGHFASTSIGYRSRDMEFVSRPGQTAQYALPGEIEMKVGEPECQFYTGPFAGSIRQCRIALRFIADGESISKEIAMAKPLFWKGFQIHMSQVMGKDLPAAFTVPEFQLLVKRDPGLRLIVIAFPILILFTLYFYIEEKLLKRRNHYEG